MVKLTVATHYDMPPRYAEARPARIKEENKRLIEEYEDNVLYEITASSVDILCLMALTEALGLEYGGFVSVKPARE